MRDGRNWRVARFKTGDLRAEFVAHALALKIDGLQVEPIEREAEIRFRAPAEFEVGIANMIVAHGGKVIPTRKTDSEVAPVGI